MLTFKQIERRWKKSTYSFPVTPNKSFKVETTTPGEFCKLTPRYDKTLAFVTMEDIFGGQFENNHVIYNPILPKEKRMEVLRKAHEFHFKHHPITDDDLDILTVYNDQHLNEFIIAYKEFLNIT